MPAPRQISDRQIQLLLQYMEDNRALAVGQLNNSGPMAKHQNLVIWNKLAVTLNSVGAGVTRSGAKWRDVSSNS